MEKQNLYIFNFSLFVLKLFSIVFGVGIIFSYIFEHHVIFNSKISGASKINRILYENQAEETPIFGSSRAQGNFVPSTIHPSCYNYGIDGVQANIWLFFLEKELEKNKNTPIIINFDLRGLVFKDGDIHNYIPNWDKTHTVLSEKGKLYYTTPFVKYFGHYQAYLKYYLNEKFNLTKITDKGGSFEKNVLLPSKFNDLVAKRLETETTFTLKKSLYQKFNYLLKKTEREIIVVVSPYHYSFFNKFTNINEADQFLQELQKIENISVVDMRNNISGDSLFVNTTHLNYKGAQEFSKQLKFILMERKIFIQK